MRILFLTAITGRQGTWFRCANLGEQLAKLGHEVTLVKVGTNRFFSRVAHESGMRIVDTPRFFGWRFSHYGTRLPSDLLARAGLVLSEPFDVVHAFTHFANVVVPSALVRFAPRSPPVLIADWDDLYTDDGIFPEPTWHDPLRRVNYLVDAGSERHFKRLAQAVTVVSEELIERSVSHGVPREQVRLIPNGAPVDAIRPIPLQDARTSLSLPAGRKIILFSGFAAWDIDLVLDAVALISADLDVLALFTGPSPEVTLSAAAARGLTSRVRVDGLVPFASVPLYMSAADVGLVPFSDKAVNRARWPIKLGDYLAAGLPVATHDVGEMGRFVKKWGVGVATGCDASAYARGIESLLRGNTDALRARAREVALLTSWGVAARILEELYVDTLRERASSRERT
jgi:glycosyltransferase involved in cell wall biosynthesis